MSLQDFDLKRIDLSLRTAALISSIERYKEAGFRAQLQDLNSKVSAWNDSYGLFYTLKAKVKETEEQLAKMRDDRETSLKNLAYMDEGQEDEMHKIDVERVLEDEGLEPFLA